MEGKLPWIPLYSELAPALLSCKKDRKPLVDWIYSDISQVGEKSLVDYIHMRDGSNVKDIDPFSVFAIFNRPLKVENRVAMSYSSQNLKGYGGSMNIYGITVDSPAPNFKMYYKQMSEYERAFMEIIKDI